MYLSIKELSEILGISLSTVRRFEDKGLINVKRDQNNGYRMYSTFDLLYLSVCQGMQEQGITAKDIRSSADSLAFSTLQQITEKRIENLKQMEESIRESLRCWEFHLFLLELAEKLLTQPEGDTVIELPSMHLFPLGSDAKSIHDAVFFQLLRQKKKPLQQVRLCYSFESMPDGRVTSIDTGIVMKSSLLSDIYDGGVVYPAQRYIVHCLNGIALVDVDDPQSLHSYTAMIEEKVRGSLEAHHVSPAAKPFSMMVAVNPTSGLSLLLIPIGDQG